jgi:hypothetical protein
MQLPGLMPEELGVEADQHGGAANAMAGTGNSPDGAAKIQL